MIKDTKKQQPNEHTSLRSDCEANNICSLVSSGNNSSRFGGEEEEEALGVGDGDLTMLGNSVEDLPGADS